jgi:hypothetical protein
MTEPENESTDQAREHYDHTELPLSTLRRVAANRPGRPQEAFALRLPPEVVDELVFHFELRGMGVTQLVREWIVERLELERRRLGSGSWSKLHCCAYA